MQILCQILKAYCNNQIISEIKIFSWNNWLIMPIWKDFHVKDPAIHHNFHIIHIYF